MELKPKDNQTLEDLHKSLTEVKTTNRFILRRLNHVVDSGTSGSCCCANVVSSEEKYKNINTRLSKLESNQDATDDSVKQLNQQLKELHIDINNLQEKRNVMRNQPLPEVKTNSVKPIARVDDLSDDQELQKSTKSDLDPNTASPIVPESHILESKTAIVLQDTSFNQVKQVNELSTRNVDRTICTTDFNKVDTSITSSETSVQTEGGHVNNKVKEDQDKTAGKLASGNVDMSNGNNESGQPEIITRNEKKTERSEAIQIKKPNFGRDSKSSYAESNTTPPTFQGMPTVIVQNMKKFHPDHKYWDFLGFKEVSEARNSEVKDIGGAHTVICIDISTSVSRGEAWKHVTTFLNSYIGGLEEVAQEHGFKDDHVALVTFGHDTRVIQRFTNDMSKIRKSLGNIKLGGPSPMYGGLEMATQAAASTEKTLSTSKLTGHMGHINGLPVPTKIVLITDGELTDSCLYEGPDEADLNKVVEAKTHVMSTMQFYKKTPPIDFFCIAVGNSNMDFLKLMTGVSNGKMISYMDGRQFARRSYLMTKTQLSMPFDPLGLFGQMSGKGLSDPMGLLSQLSGQGSSDQLKMLSEMSKQLSSQTDTLRMLSGMSGQGSADPLGLFSQMSGQSKSDEGDHQSLSVQDKEQIEDIKKHALEQMGNMVSVKSSLPDQMYLDPDSTQLPAVGTRVRRGPDWMWNMQDNNGPGTVIGQFEAGHQLWVEWDADGETNVYRYGHGNYDLLIVDEPRNVTDGKLAVGCTVRPGKDFQYSGTKIGPGEKGVTIKINQAKHTARVKWGNKERGKYKYSDNIHGTIEIKMSSPYQKQQSNVLASEMRLIKKAVYKNKNKNT